MFAQWCFIFSYLGKLDGVGSVDNRTSTDKLHHFVQKEEEEKNVTCDTWQMTHDMLGGWTFSQNFSFLAPTVCDLWYYEDMEEKADSISESVNELMTAPATPGLLKTS